MLYQFAKRTKEDPEIAVKCFGKWSTAPEDMVRADYEVWNSLWQKLQRVATAPWRTREQTREEDEDAMEVLTVTTLRKAARSFKTKTTVGVDAISPSHFAWLSDQLLCRVASLLARLEEEGMWPSQLQQAIVHLIPKASGGRRPIGLLPSLVRVWERARKPVIEGWGKRNLREYDWMRTGRGAERSAWAQSVLEEAARGRGRKRGQHKMW
jgi:hypothetical protein